MERVVQGFEVAGVAILVVGTLLAFVSAALGLRRGGGRTAYQRARQGVGRAILLGLEVLIIADIVLTITVDRTFDSAITLGLIVLVRTFLSFSWRSSWRGPCPGVAARRTSGRTQPAASATDLDEPSARLRILGCGSRCLPPGAGHAAQPQPLSQQQDAADRTPGGPDRHQQVGVDRARQQQQGAKPELQGAEHDPAQGPAAPH